MLSNWRKPRVVLTPRGRALEPEVTSRAERQNATALADLNDQEQAQFLDLMARAIRTMQADQG